MSKISPYAKAIAGAVVAFVTAGATATVSDNTITTGEWWMMAAAAAVAGGAVFGIPNGNSPEQGD